MIDEERNEFRKHLLHIEKQNGIQIDQNNRAIEQNDEMLIILRGPLDRPDKGLIAQHNILWEAREEQRRTWKRMIGTLYAAASLIITAFVGWVATKIGWKSK